MPGPFGALVGGGSSGGGILGGIARTIGGAILGGAASGLSKRFDAQVAGKKGNLYGRPEGGLQAQQAQIYRDQVHNIGSRQSSSQGQQMEFQSSMQYNQLMHEKEENRLQRAHEMQLTRNAQQDAGQADPWYGLRHYNMPPRPRNVPPTVWESRRQQYAEELR